uniref:Cation_ATPase_C domain-containing protein n=1 Tax=Caenorhabditis tropicalis TaxID=1561998 RepID=A0A1I7UZH9_9PELO
MSPKTLEFHRTLFRTLVSQTILPLILVFTPSGLVLTLPLLGLYEGPLVNIVGVTVAFYPSLEPIVTVICIKEFRKLEFGKKDDRVLQPRHSCAVT